MPESLLHHRQHIVVAAAFGIDQLRRRQPGLGQRGREQVAFRKHPQDQARAGQSAGRYARREQGRGGIVGQAGACSRQLMEGGNPQTPAGKLRIHARNAERKARVLPILAGSGLDGPDLDAQGIEAKARC